jgi:hypothetical protein
LKSAELSVAALTRRRYRPPARRFSPAGFLFVFARIGLILLCMPLFWDAANASGRKNLAAHRCSQLL